MELENIPLFSPGTQGTTSHPTALKDIPEAQLKPCKKIVNLISYLLKVGCFAIEGSFQLVLLHLIETRQVRRALCAFHLSLAYLHPCHPSGLCCWHQTNHSCGALAKPVWKTVSAWPIISSQSLQCLCGNNFAAGGGSAFL